MKPLDKSIYDNVHVKASCEKAAAAAVTHDTEWAVWIDPSTADKDWPRMFTGPSDDPMGAPFVCIYDSADGYLLG